MMRKVLPFLLFIVLLAACGSTDSEENTSSSQAAEGEQEEMAAAPVDVEIELPEQPLPLKKNVDIFANVTQGEEPVNDAEYVEFEIWHTEDGQESSEKIQAVQSGEGSYTIQYNFSKSGSYQVIAHTQARGLHTMPQMEVMVEGKEESSEGHSHSHTSTPFEVSLEHKEAEEGTVLTTTIKKDGTAFEQAEVTFEIFSDQSEKHEYVDAEETEAGIYQATHSFSSDGTYNVQVHFEKPDEEIHQHKKKEITIP
ncbi:FixH family protein [Salimicrobium halophilum]|uniref:YtkA-like n=1 Tax=Salimicrobium halophilum TaxID=86666 RepID=A0A1G8U6M8_9BACI|nr:FixH family protein [Salimicrobium halophilum]SDJ49274.1 YtkA-like [Salimicrobium halophilum]